MFESLFLELGKTLYGSACEIAHSNADFFDHWNAAYENCLRDTEHPFSNIDMIEQRYESENALISAVTSGRESRAMEMTSQFGMHFLPKRTTNNLRDIKDYTITLNTLLRKAAEKAGVHPIHIDLFQLQYRHVGKAHLCGAMPGSPAENCPWLLPDCKRTPAQSTLSPYPKSGCLHRNRPGR